MFRKISLAILGIALVWVAVGAPTFAGPDPLDPSPPADEAEICGNRSMADCVAILNEKLARERPTPSPPDPQVLAVLQSDSVVQAITRGLVSGRDYWVNVDSLENPRHGNEGAMVTMVFTQPIEFSGTPGDDHGPPPLSGPQSLSSHE